MLKVEGHDEPAMSHHRGNTVEHVTAGASKLLRPDVKYHVLSMETSAHHHVAERDLCLIYRAARPLPVGGLRLKWHCVNMCAARNEREVPDPMTNERSGSSSIAVCAFFAAKADAVARS